MCPYFFEAILNYSSLLGDFGLFERALEANIQAGEYQPDHVQLLLNRAMLQIKLRSPEAALETYSRILTNSPNEKRALLGVGQSLSAVGRHGEAMRAFMDCLAIYPDDLQTLRCIAVLHIVMGEYKLVVEHLDGALDLHPLAAEMWALRGDAFDRLSRSKEAISSYDRALALDPGHKGAHYNRAGILRSAGLYSNASLGFGRLRKIDPLFRSTAGNELHCRLHSCDWSQNSELHSWIINKIEAKKLICAPFDLIGICERGDVQLINNQNYAKARFPENARTIPRRHYPNTSRRRIGYISSDFRQHAIAQVAVRLFELHDHSRFELFAFALAPVDGSQLAGRIKSAFKHFVDISNVNDQQAAEEIRSAEIDILIDLTGYGRGARPAILAARPAPVQINYLGFSATMGAASHDVIIADETAIPRKYWADFSEKVAWMPGSFFVSDDTRPILPPGNRTGVGLPEKEIVFCNFGSAFKITPDVFDSWMRILLQVDDSVLWLSEMTPMARDNLRKESQCRGVEPERLIFAERVANPAAHLGRHRLADVFLDTWPYGAHVTANDALWAGLPVVTWTGDTFASRIAASQLMALGMPELVGTSQMEYEEIVIGLAKDAGMLSSMKSKLERNIATEPLFDIHSYVRNFEELLSSLCDMERRGEVVAD